MASLSSFLYSDESVQKVQHFFGLSWKYDDSQTYQNGKDKGKHTPDASHTDSQIRNRSHKNVSANGFTSANHSTEKPSEIANGDSHRIIPVIGNRFWYWFFLIATEGGNEAFYMTGLPFWFWNVDCYALRLASLFWFFFMIAGQTLKDVLCWRRPRCPPVVSLESRYSSEHGMPSTHAMTSIGLPLLLLYFTYGRRDLPMFSCLLFAIVWATMVCVSRLYLGVHYIMDLVGGAALLAVVVLCEFFVYKQIDWAFMHWPIIVLMLPVCASLIHPSCHTWTSTRADNVMITSVLCGIYLGCYFQTAVGYYQFTDLTRPAPAIDDGDSALLMFTRFITGSVILVIARCVLRQVVLRQLSYFTGLDCFQEANRRSQLIEFLCKYLIYVPLTFSCFILPQVLFEPLNIGRPSGTYL